MIINDYVLTELNQQRRAQVAEHIATLRAANGQHRRTSPWRRTRPAPAAHPATSALVFGTPAH